MKWVKHDTDANNDAKLQNVLLDYGLEGYGLYWYCIELIASKVDKDNITFELEHDARIIARNTGSTPQKVEEMMRYFVNLGLFEDSTGVITCMKLAKRLDKSMTSNPQMREIIDNFRNHDSIMTASEKPMQDKIRLDKTRLDETKVKKAKTKLNFESWPNEPSADILSDWKKVRQSKKAPLTQTAISRMAKEIVLAHASGFTVDDCIGQAVERGWTGFKAEWMMNCNGVEKQQPSNYKDLN